MIALSAMRTHVYALAEVKNVEGVVVADVNTFINEAGNWYQANFMDHARRLTPTEAGLNSIAAGTLGVLMTPTNINRILQAYIAESATDAETFTSTARPALEYIRKPEEIYLLRRQSTANGTIRYWAAYRVDGTAGQWRILFHPPPSATAHIAVYVDEHWIDLTADANIPDVTPDDAYAICRIAAIDVAMVLARDRAKIDAIAKLLPEHVRAKMALHERVLTARTPV